MSHRARSFELASVNACEHIARVDVEVHSYPAEFISANLATIYVAVNSWLLLIREFCGDSYIGVLHAMEKRGLVDTIARFADAADLIVKDQPVSDALIADVLGDVIISPRSLRVTSLGYVPSVKAVQLEICRYLKRMGLTNRPEVDKSVLCEFHERQQMLGQGLTGSYLPLDTDLVQSMRQALSDAIDWPRLIARLTSMDARARLFTPGASSDGGSSVSGKLVQMARTNPGFFRPICGSWEKSQDGKGFYAPSQAVDTSRCDLGDVLNLGIPMPLALLDEFGHKHEVRIATAPKSVKGPRIIAMEPVNLQMAERYAQRVLYDFCPAGVDLYNQSPNQEFAAEGARIGNFATLDLSAASDFVTKNLVVNVFPEAFVRAIWWMVPTHYRLDGKSWPLYSFATMGNGLTFWVETLVFWAVCKAVTGTDCTVYGDDIIVPNKCAVAVVDALESLGFIVNRSKSFWAGTYRESCGVEFDGSDAMTSLYYPRFPIVGEITEHTASLSTDGRYSFSEGRLVDSTSKLIALQHKLSNYSRAASTFVADVIRDAHPDMTMHRWGSVCDDLWGPEDVLGPDMDEKYAVGYIPYRYYTDSVCVVGTIPAEYPPSWTDDADDDEALCGFFPPYATFTERYQLFPGHQCPSVYRSHVVYEKDAREKPFSAALVDYHTYWQFLEFGPESDCRDIPGLEEFDLTRSRRPQTGRPRLIWRLEPDI